MYQTIIKDIIDRYTKSISKGLVKLFDSVKKKENACQSSFQRTRLLPRLCISLAISPFPLGIFAERLGLAIPLARALPPFRLPGLAPFFPPSRHPACATASSTRPGLSHALAPSPPPGGARAVAAAMYRPPRRCSTAAGATGLWNGSAEALLPGGYCWVDLMAGKVDSAETMVDSAVGKVDSTATDRS
ncbi:hypothetical protein C2845_PM18G00120 [Panicum miliaceum]|uniref:Uncharacterized protein n=1 Tax=Panicum miliaceum TaxID=4540 RepID=A0A3L6PK71_PANMI|nr:hypothetical protein C2845_PM18G00120 [Panicum miliaceum]